MRKVILISGLAGSGKTYVAEQIEQEIGNMMSVKLVPAIKHDFFGIVNAHNDEDELLVVEMHPEFPNIKQLVNTDIKHIVISKDYSEYMARITDVKKEFLRNWFEVNDRKNWVGDIIEYNKRRFEHIRHCEGDFMIVNCCEEALSEIFHYVQDCRTKELFKFVDKNYGHMMYHSLSFGSVGYEGTAPTFDKFRSLHLQDINPKGSCLDIGCNMGYISYLLDRNYELNVTGIDIVNKNIECATWLRFKFFRKQNIDFITADFMDVPGQYDYVFALAVLHHAAKEYDFKDICKKVGDLTKKACFIEINEMPGWNKMDIIAELTKYFNKVEFMGNSLLPVSKEKVNNRWLIRCFKEKEK